MSRAITTEEALVHLAERGIFFISTEPKRSLSVRELGERIGFSRDWVMDHLNEFPNAWRAPGAGGELRIPLRDVEAFEKRCKIKRA